MSFKLLSIFILLHSIGFGQLKLDGIYKGKNLYVNNPISEDANSFCVERIYINGSKFDIDTDRSVFEIPLDSLGIEINDSVHIAIYHKPDCTPRILTPYKSPPTPIKIQNLEIDEVGLITWEASIDSSCLLIVQQYKWHKWINLDTLQTGTQGPYTSQSYQTELHSGSNKFRLDMASSSFFQRYTQTIETTSLKPAVSYTIDKSNRSINFDKATYYELYDMHGECVIEANSKSISLINLKNRKYVLCFDNSTEKIKLKWNNIN